MPELISYMRRFRRSVESGSGDSGEVGASALFRRLDAFGCLLLFADAGVRAEVAVERLSELFNRIERELNQWVKAAVESTLEHLGTVGALAVEDFWTKLKTALQEVGRPLVEPNA